jgi:hypothetical protein
MPYIHESKRADLNPAVDALVALLRDMPRETVDGSLNYVVTRLLLDVYGIGPYANLQRGLGLLEAVKGEYYRRAVAPYEDRKCLENGDVYHA